MKINEDNLLNAVIKGSAIVLVIAVAASTLFFSRQVSLGILAGGLIAILNFVWQRSVMSRLLLTQVEKPAVVSTIRFILRLAVIALVLYAILVSGIFSVAGLLVGLSVVVITIVFFTLCLAIQNKGD